MVFWIEIFGINMEGLILECDGVINVCYKIRKMCIENKFLYGLICGGKEEV